MTIITHYHMLSFFILVGVGHSAVTSAFLAGLPSRTMYETAAVKSKRTTHLFWSDGKNAAPAVICEVENIPILEPIPEG